MNFIHRMARKMTKSAIEKVRSSQFLRNSSSEAVVPKEEKKMLELPPFVKMPPHTVRREQKFDYFLVLDFEATCDNPVNPVPQEIIEVPVLKISGVTFETESIFHSYVRPVANPEITKFCTQLTGITQEVVDSYPAFEEVIEEFHSWLKAEDLLKYKFAFATCGDWDFKYLLPMQCKGMKIKIPEYMHKWINIKASFLEFTQTYPRNLITMMKYCQLQHEGRLHSGIDDCKNIAKVLKDLADRGIVYELNGGIYRI